MATRTIFVTGLRILGVCILFAVCFTVSGVLSGIDKIAQRPVASQHASPATQPVPQAPENLLSGFLIFILCVGVTLSYFILRSRWHGWALVGAVFVSTYGISTVASQLDSVAFLSDKLPQGMIRALFVQGAITMALFAPFAVLALGKWRAAPLRAPVSHAVPLTLSSIILRLAILVVAFVFLYMFFGYYVAWRNPELRHFYAGPEFPTLWASLQHNWTSHPWIFFLAAFRALIYIACLYPLVRMLYTSRRESAFAAALFSACWTTLLLLPNPLLPASVARSHFWETLGFNLVFGALAGWLLCCTAPAPSSERPNSQIGSVNAAT
jgi:hypothetical protein